MIREHSVKRIRKSLTGNGNATKEQVREIVGHLLSINTRQMALDASDALALALGDTRMGIRSLLRNPKRIPIFKPLK